MNDILFIVIIILAVILIWFFSLRLLRTRRLTVGKNLIKYVKSLNEKILMQPKAGVYCGSETDSNNLNDDGVLCLTEKRLIFENSTGECIEFMKDQISGASMEDTFKGKSSSGTERNYLVVRRHDDAAVAFLLKQPELWVWKFAMG